MSEQARSEALAFLTSRARSEQEVRTRLAQRGHSADDIDEAVDFLYEYRYLDDGQFCAAFIHDKVRFSPCGRNKLAYELGQKGVDGATIEEALAEHFSEEDEEALAQRLWQKKAAQTTDPIKIKRYLAGKGFAYELIERICDKNLEYLDELE